MKAINSVENLKHSSQNSEVIACNVTHASATMMRENNTLGFSFIDYNSNLNIFLNHINAEKQRIKSTNALYPSKNGFGIHGLAMPWLNFTGHKEPRLGLVDPIAKKAFSKAHKVEDKL